MRSSVPVPVAAVAVAVSVLLLAGCSEGGHEGRRPVEGTTKGAAGASLGDFNGDGYDDFATAVRPTSASRGPLPARLAVVYGGAHGLDPRHRLVVNGAEDDYVGPLLRTDLDRDGFTDLVTARFRHGSSPRAERKGETVVLRGGPRGLAAPRPLGGGGAGFLALAVGDFDGDGAADLLASAADGQGDGRGDGRGDSRGDGRGAGRGAGRGDSRGDGRGAGRGAGRSAVRVLYGPFGAKAHPARTAPLPTGPTDRPRRSAPATATAGDFNGDHRTDVVLTYRYGLGQADQPEPGDTAPLDTPVAHYRGGPKGLVRDKRPEARLAHALGTEDGPREPTAGDADHDGIDDLLAPGQGTLGPGRHRASGRLTVVHGAKPGLGRGRADLTVDQSAPGMPGDARRGDGFGGSPAVGDITGDGRPDLVVATPEKNNGNGRLTLLPGSRHGRGGEYAPDQAKGSHREHGQGRGREHGQGHGQGHGRERGGVQSLDLDTPGVPGRHTPYGFDAFAPQPPLLDVDGDGHEDVVAAAPGYGRGRTGGFWILRGTDRGLSTGDVRRFTPADLGIRFRAG